MKFFDGPLRGLGKKSSDFPETKFDDAQQGSKPQQSGNQLQGQRFNLKPFNEEDISSQYIGWLNDPTVNRFLEVRFAHQTFETALDYVRGFYREEEKYMWGIYSNDTDKPIGTATLSVINRIHGSTEIGLMIGETEHWGKGASNESMDLVLNFAFESLGLHRVTGGSYASNLGMNFAFKRLGFTLEGRRRKAMLVSSGSYVDGYCWSILADEWQASCRLRANKED